jgi:integrase
MRVGEAIGLDCGDFDTSNGTLTIRNGKFGKFRELPLHPSTVTALSSYLGRSDRPCQPLNTSAFFVSVTGTRLLYSNVGHTFHHLIRRAGLTPRSAACRPRIHDLRHGYAINTILDGYRINDEPGPRLALLSTYLGHVDPRMTYWYLSVAPELMKLACDRLERHLGGGS